MTEYLRVEDLLALCADLGDLVVRDVGLLDSAAHRPTTDLFGREAYGSVEAKAAVLLESIARNHPLVDGNKRLAWVSAVVFLGLNGITLDAPDDDAYALVVGVAAGEIPWELSAPRLRGWLTA